MKFALTGGYIKHLGRNRQVDSPDGWHRKLRLEECDCQRAPVGHLKNLGSLGGMPGLCQLIPKLLTIPGAKTRDEG